MKGSHQRIILYFVEYKIFGLGFLKAFVLGRFFDGFLVLLVGMFTILEGWVIS